MATSQQELFAKYGIELERLRNQLAVNISNKGISTSSTATLQELVPMVSQISGGGNSMYILTDEQIIENTGSTLISALSYSDENAFAVDKLTFGSNFSYMNLPNAKIILSNAFYNWSYFDTTNNYLNIPNIERIEEYGLHGGGVTAAFRAMGTITFENFKTYGSAPFYLAQGTRDTSNNITLNFPHLSYVSSYMFSGSMQNISVNFPNVTSILSGVIRYVNGINSSSNLMPVFSFPKLQILSNQAFADCSYVKLHFIPENILQLGQNAFNSAKYFQIINSSGISLNSLYFSQVRSISAYCFSNCNLGDVSFNNNINFYFNNLLAIQGNAFAQAQGFTINFSTTSSTCIYSNAFYGGSNLSSGRYVNLPSTIKAFYIGSYAFYNTQGGLTNIDYYGSTLYTMTFYNCQTLQTVSLHGQSSTTIMSYAFASASSLSSLYLYNSSKMVTLAASAYAVFQGTPIYSGSGTIYVPSALYSSYISATNWAALSSCFSAM